MRKCLILLMLVLLPSVLAIEAIKPYVNDFTWTLTSDQIADLQKYATEIDNKTGYEIAVVLVQRKC